MRPIAVVVGEDIEEEWFNVIVQRLVIEEELGKEAEVLAVDPIRVSVDFEHRQRTLAVDLVAGRMIQPALDLQHHNSSPANPGGRSRCRADDTVDI